jgi:hypothetical protein
MGREQIDSSDARETTIGKYPQATRASRGHFSSWTPFFVGVLVFVGGVSLYDGYLVVQNVSVIRDVEKNPVGVYLLDCDGGSPGVFLRVKAAGTLITLTGLSLLHHHSKRLSVPVEVGVVLFQAALLLFLENPFS